MRKKWQIKNKKWKIPYRGFTLVELLIYMGIFMLLLTVLTQLFVSIVDTKLSSQATSSVAGDGRYIYSRLIYDVNRASSINPPQNLGDTSSSLGLVIDGVTYTYAVSNGVLSRSGTLGTEALNGYDTKVSSLQFQRIGNTSGKPTVQILFTLTSSTSARGKVESTQFQTTAGLR